MENKLRKEIAMITKNVYTVESEIYIRALLPLTVGDLSQVLHRLDRNDDILMWVGRIEITHSATEDGSQPIVMTVWDANTWETHELSVDSVKRALEEISLGMTDLQKQTRLEIRDAIQDGSLVSLSSDAYDALIQIALFRTPTQYV